MKWFLLLIIINLILVDRTFLLRLSNRRVIGGKEAFIEDVPFMASLIMKFKEPHLIIFSGGASVIGKYWAITAAHCVHAYADNLISSYEGFVRSNTSNWKNDVYKRDHLIKEYIVHEKYKNEGEDYDIALIKVKEAFDGIFEKPIKYARKNYKYEEKTTVTTLGWGTTKPNVEPYTVPELREVDIVLTEQKYCIQLYDKISISLSPRMVCASAPGKDACINDSGGPLVQRDDQNITLIGIVSWGVSECANGKFPGVYTKVSKFNNWIGKRLHHYHRHQYDSNTDESNPGIDTFDVYHLQ